MLIHPGERAKAGAVEIAGEYFKVNPYNGSCFTYNKLENPINKTKFEYLYLLLLILTYIYCHGLFQI